MRSRLQTLAGSAPQPEGSSVELMLAQTAERPFSRDGWLFELKYDGWRLLADVRPGAARLLSRRRTDATADHPALVRALSSLNVRALFDGELVALDPQGRPQFQLLQQGAPTTYFVFDLLGLDGVDLRRLPLLQRKALLREVLAGADDRVRFTDHIDTQGEALFEQVREMGLEGVMAKDAQSPYRGGRAEEWLKVCVDRRLDLVVVGFSLSDTGRGMGALHLAGYLDGALTYAGKVGAAMPQALRTTLQGALESRRTAKAPCAFPKGTPPPSGPRECWSAPELTCEVRVKDITEAGSLRQPVFCRLRSDKPLQDCAHPLASR